MIDSERLMELYNYLRMSSPLTIAGSPNCSMDELRAIADRLEYVRASVWRSVKNDPPRIFCVQYFVGTDGLVPKSAWFMPDGNWQLTYPCGNVMPRPKWWMEIPEVPK